VVKIKITTTGLTHLSKKEKDMHHIPAGRVIKWKYQV